MRYACGCKASQCPLSIVGGGGLSLVLSDMGNGVTRVSDVACVAKPSAGWCAARFPLPSRVFDAVCTALGLVSCPPLCTGCVPDGRLRWMDEAHTEYVVWPVA